MFWLVQILSSKAAQKSRCKNTADDNHHAVKQKWKKMLIQLTEKY